MAVETPQKGSVVARPTKSFFVHMLTRDIELQDALLDLLDNCVDGIVRKRADANESSVARPYEGYRAVLTMAKDHFSIEDNCGGIPISVARKYAFAIGKPEGSQDFAKHTTVGMYGIGMKRAIFKLGTEALVESQYDEGFVVEFTPQWMGEDSWENLPMYEQAGTSSIAAGTRIVVYELNEEAKLAFSDALWVDEFRKAVARHYALIIAKGFQVVIGSPDEIEQGIDPIRGEDLHFLVTERGGAGEIYPFVYRGECSGVAVEIYAGLYRQLLSSDDGELEEETRGTSDDAGWTIACNDRVVVWKDKTRLTGWGEATVPNYHGQFIAITGIALLEGNPNLLPLTTTKRGVDAATNIYSEVKDMMREATKALTTFTNRWKKFPDGLEDLYRGGRYVDLASLRASSSAKATVVSRRYPGINKYEPSYPVPVQESTSSRVSFLALKSDISELATHYYGDQRVKSGDVGRAAFDEAVARLRRRVDAV